MKVWSAKGGEGVKVWSAKGGEGMKVWSAKGGEGVKVWSAKGGEGVGECTDAPKHTTMTAQPHIITFSSDTFTAYVCA